MSLLTMCCLRLRVGVLLMCAAVAHAAPAWAARMVGMGDGNDSVAFTHITRLGLPVLDIQLAGGEWPTAEYVVAPEGHWGKSIVNPTRVPGRMQMYVGGSVVYDTGEYVDADSVTGMTLRIRGNSTAWKEKKPYKIKLQHKADLLRRDSIDGRDKNWALIRDEHLFAMQGFEVNRILGMPWTPGYQYVNVVINNRYEGIYMLVESVRRNTDCRLNVSKEGYIFESDAYWWKEPIYLTSGIYNRLRYTFKYPDEDDFTAADTLYMTSLVRQMERSYMRDNYPEVIDVRSYAAWCLGHDILGTKDYPGTNRFYLKYDKSDTTRVVMPLLWDFDSSESVADNWSQPHLWFYSYLFNNANRTFVDEFVNLWNRVSPTLYETIFTHFDTMRRSREGSAISLSLQLNNQRWGTSYLIYTCFIDRPAWIKSRVEWLNAEVAKLNATMGDVDLNGHVDVDDVNAVINMILEYAEPNLATGDMNGDGKLDVVDLQAIIDLVLK
ncbi:MAG: CotH kinase family protein [Muribaculaceae bacterium]|nr:CotH kinase family protein [Muribaculaceae bacterium]